MAFSFRHRFDEIDRAIEIPVDRRTGRFEVKAADLLEVVDSHSVSPCPFPCPFSLVPFPLSLFPLSVAPEHRREVLERSGVEDIFGL